MNAQEYVLPASWACLLINGDDTGCDDHEKATISIWQAQSCLAPALSVSNDTFLTRYSDAAPLLDFELTECATYVFPKEEEKTK